MVIGSRSEAWARIRRLGCVTSDIFEIAGLHRAQRLEGVNPRTVTIAERHTDPVIADIPDPRGRHVERYALGVKQAGTRHFVAAGGPLTRQPQATRAHGYLGPV